MEPAKERIAGVESAMQLLWKELNSHLELCLSADSMESAIFSKEKELEERESKVAALERVLEEKQKVLEQRSLDLESKEKALVEEIMKEKKLEDEIEEKSEGKIESPEAKLDSAIRSDSEKEMKGITRKRSRKVLEMEQGSTKPRASGTARHGQVQDGLSFLLTITQAPEKRDSMTVPSCFVAAYDLSKKKQVILSTDEGEFGLEVKHYADPRRKTSQHVTFRRGWREFYCKNRLSIGMQCLFKVKEHTVNADASVFSMEVSVLGR